MHVGMSTVFQNPHRGKTDFQVYREELRLADLAEPMGYESIWGVEHHFTDYTLCPDVIQFLTYMAGRTRDALLGTMVVVLPWHDPVRVAEEASMLDNMSDGRMILGIGRGLAKVEFDGFRLDMSQSRARFFESAEMLLEDWRPGIASTMARLLSSHAGTFAPSPSRASRVEPTPLRCPPSRLSLSPGWVLGY